MPLVALGATVALVSLVPLGFIVSIAFQLPSDVLWPLIFRPRVAELLGNTLLLVAIATPLSVALGVGAAWVVERTNLPGRRVWAVILAAPLAIPAFVSSYGWVSQVPALSGLFAAVLIATLAYFPLVYLPAMAAIRGLDPALEESARSLGLSDVAVFFRVVLPQLRLAISGGTLIVALHLLAEYGAFAHIRFDTFTTAVIAQFQSSFAGPAASALGGVLATICLLFLIAESRVRGSSRYARVGSGAPSPAIAVRLGSMAPLVAAGFGILLAAAIGVPLLSVLRWLGAGDPWAQPALLTAILHTAALVTAGAVLTVLAALPVAWLSVRFPGPLSRTIEGAGYVSSSFPAIIVALALVTVTIRIVPSLYQTAFTVLLAYVIIFLPRALVSIRPGIAQAPPSLEEASFSLGRSLLHTRLRVTMPLILPAVAAGAALVALGAANELTATLLLAPSGTRTLATQFWSESSALNYSDAAPYAVLLIALSIPAVAIMFTQSTRKSHK